MQSRLRAYYNACRHRHVIIHCMFSVSESRTIVICDWFFLPEAIEQEIPIEKSVELFHRVNSQDFGTCELTQPSMFSVVYARGGALVPREHHIEEFHTW